MKIPTDIPLHEWITGLIKKDQIELFYFTDEWKELRQEVLDDHHNECQECIKEAIYTRADCVHHINEIRKRPDLALSKYYIDISGNKHKNLIPLCNTCHNLIHDKLGEWQRKDKFMNEEKW